MRGRAPGRGNGLGRAGPAGEGVWTGRTERPSRDLRLDEAPHEEPNDESRDDQEDPATRRRLREMKLRKANGVEIEGSRVGLCARPSSGHDEDGVEELD